MGEMNQYETDLLNEFRKENERLTKQRVNESLA